MLKVIKNVSVMRRTLEKEMLLGNGSGQDFDHILGSKKDAKRNI
ncbi:hypothetical protein [Cellulosilyticum ruminicola]|nr:hypothetical protein [Cellulosilyticum ruminicola]